MRLVAMRPDQARQLIAQRQQVAEGLRKAQLSLVEKVVAQVLGRDLEGYVRRSDGSFAIPYNYRGAGNMLDALSFVAPSGVGLLLGAVNRIGKATRGTRYIPTMGPYVPGIPQTSQAYAAFYSGTGQPIALTPAGYGRGGGGSGGRGSGPGGRVDGSGDQRRSPNPFGGLY